jgi:hypothetical protein
MGKELDIMKVTSRMIKEKRIFAIGGEIYEGDDVFQISEIEELAFLKALHRLGGNEFNIIDTYFYSGNDGEGEIDASKLPRVGKLKYFNGYKDHHSSESVYDLRERYDEDGEVSKVMQRYLRAKKINKIHNNANID